AVERARALDRPEIGHVLDDADDAGIALRIAAQRTGIGGVEIAADRAGADPLRGLGKRRRQGLHQPFAPLQEKERRAPGRARAETGQFGEQLNEAVDVAHEGSALTPDADAAAALKTAASCRAAIAV